VLRALELVCTFRSLYPQQETGRMASMPWRRCLSLLLVWLLTRLATCVGITLDISGPAEEAALGGPLASALRIAYPAPGTPAVVTFGREPSVDHKSALETGEGSELGGTDDSVKAAWRSLGFLVLSTATEGTNRYADPCDAALLLVSQRPAGNMATAPQPQQPIRVSLTWLHG